MWLLTAWRCVLKMLKESFGHSLLHWYYCDDVDPIVISSRCPSVLLCLVGDFFFLLSFLMVNLCFLSCCLLVDHVVFEERYVRSFDGMEASFHELKLVHIFSVVFLVVVNGFKFFCVLCFLS